MRLKSWRKKGESNAFFRFLSAGSQQVFSPPSLTYLDNGIMTTPKCRLVSFVLACPLLLLPAKTTVLMSATNVSLWFHIIVNYNLHDFQIYCQQTKDNLLVLHSQGTVASDLISMCHENHKRRYLLKWLLSVCFKHCSFSHKFQGRSSCDDNYIVFILRLICLPLERPDTQVVILQPARLV